MPFEAPSPVVASRRPPTLPFPRKLLRQFASLSIATFLIAGGCSGKPEGGDLPDGLDPPTVSQGDQVPGSLASPSLSEAGAVDVRPAAWSDIEAWTQTHKGQVVVVDLWSTWCKPCVREFPHLLEVQTKYGDKIVCGSVSLDYYGGETEVPADVLASVRKFLEEQNAKIANFISLDGDEATMKKVGVAAIPAVMVFDRDGKLAKVFKNDDGEFGKDGFGYEKDIIPYLDQLTKQ